MDVLASLLRVDASSARSVPFNVVHNDLLPTIPQFEQSDCVIMLARVHWPPVNCICYFQRAVFASGFFEGEG